MECLKQVYSTFLGFLSKRLNLVVIYKKSGAPLRNFTLLCTSSIPFLVT